MWLLHPKWSNAVNEFPPSVKSSDQVFWISVKIVNGSIYMANIYLAPNAQDKEENCLAAENFIREVHLLSENPKIHIVIAGDWNADPYKKSGANSRILNKVLNETSLKMIQRPSHKSYTCATPGRSSSHIDHFLVSANIAKCVVSAIEYIEYHVEAKLEGTISTRIQRHQTISRWRLPLGGYAKPKSRLLPHNRT